MWPLIVQLFLGRGFLKGIALRKNEKNVPHWTSNFCKLLLNGVLHMPIRLVVFIFFEWELKIINFHFCCSPFKMERRVAQKCLNVLTTVFMSYHVLGAPEANVYSLSHTRTRTKEAHRARGVEAEGCWGYGRF